MQGARWLMTACLLLAAPAAAEVSVELTPTGVWLGATGGAPCFVPRVQDALDRARLEDELARLRDAGGPVVLAPRRGVVYRDFIAVMDLANKVGLGQTSIGAPADLAVAFDDRQARRRRGHCTLPAVRPARPTPPAPPAAEPGFFPDVAWAARLAVPIALPSRESQRQRAPVIIVTTTELTLAGKTLGDVPALTGGTGRITVLEAALAKLRVDTPVAIIQADASLDAALVQRIADTAAHAGFPDVLFAVAQRQPGGR